MFTLVFNMYTVIYWDLAASSDRPVLFIYLFI